MAYSSTLWEIESVRGGRYSRLMDLAELAELSDTEIVARLVQRGMEIEDARSIVTHREDRVAALQIGEVLGR